MKKLFAAILAVCMVLTMAACASGNSSSPAATTAAPAASADTTASAGDTNGDSVYRIGVYNYLSGLALGTEEVPSCFPDRSGSLQRQDQR